MDKILVRDLTKTFPTLIRIMAGLERQTAGQITIARADARKPLTAMVFQENPVFPWMTVEANVHTG